MRNYSLFKNQHGMYFIRLSNEAGNFKIKNDVLLSQYTLKSSWIIHELFVLSFFIFINRYKQFLYTCIYIYNMYIFRSNIDTRSSGNENKYLPGFIVFVIMSFLSIGLNGLQLYMIKCTRQNLRRGRLSNGTK